MGDLINFFDFIKDFVGPTELTFIVIAALISFYFSNQKNQKDLAKTTSSIDTSLDVLSNSILAMNNSNKELVLNLTSLSNDLAKSIITGVYNSLITLKDEEKALHDRTFEKNIDGSKKLDDELYDILLATNSDLVILTQLHNGGTNLNGIPFAKYDITNQTNSRNALPFFGQTTSRPISEYSLIYQKALMDSDNIFWGNIDEIEEDYDNSISIRLKQINKRSLMCIGLTNSNNILYAFINIFFNNTYLTEELIRSFNISKSKFQIENILNGLK